MGEDDILGKAEEIEEQEEFVHNSLEPEGGADGIQEQEVIAKKPHNPKGRLLPNEQRLTKKDTEDPFLGQPRLFSNQFLPLTGAVLNHSRVLQLRNQQRKEDGKFIQVKYEANKQTVKDVIRVWEKGPFPTILSKGIEKRILNLQKNHQSLLKHKNMAFQSYRVKEEQAKTEYQKLFDITKKDWKKENRRAEMMQINQLKTLSIWSIVW